MQKQRKNYTADMIMTLSIAMINSGIVLYRLWKKLNARVRLTTVAQPIKLLLNHRSKSELNNIMLVPLTDHMNKDNLIAELMYNVIIENRDYLQEFLPWPKYIKCIDHETQFIKRCDHGLKQDVGIVYSIILPNKQIIGSVGYNYIDWNNSVGFIGYWLAQGYQKNGIMTQSVKQLMEFGFNILKLDHIHISAAETNYKSRSIPERLNYIKYDNIIDQDSLGNKLITYIISVKSPKISPEKSVHNYFYRDILQAKF
eukprot:164907_1